MEESIAGLNVLSHSFGWLELQRKVVSSTNTGKFTKTIIKPIP